MNDSSAMAVSQAGAGSVDGCIGLRPQPSGGDAYDVWRRLVKELHAVLTASSRSDDFVTVIAGIGDSLLSALNADPDALLFVALSEAGRGLENYAASHALRVAAGCELAASLLTGYEPAERRLVIHLALTMNIAMAAEQNRMALQYSGLTPAQRDLVRRHAALGAEMLRGLGVDDLRWLKAVEMHHDPPASDLGSDDVASRAAALVHRADVLLAGFSRRGRREALSSMAASRRALAQDSNRADAASAALIKALGIYPPGTLVKLANHEVAVVRWRGLRVDQPHVLAVLRPDGMPHLSFKRRDTSLSVYRVVHGLAQSAINLRLPFERLLAQVS